MIWLVSGWVLEWRIREREVQAVNPIIGPQTVDTVPNSVIVFVVPPEWVGGVWARIASFTPGLYGDGGCCPRVALRTIALLFGIIQVRGNEAMIAENELLAAGVVVVSNQLAKDIINNWKANSPNFRSSRVRKATHPRPTGSRVLRSQLLPRFVRNKHAFTAPP